MRAVFTLLLGLIVGLAAVGFNNAETYANTPSGVDVGFAQHMSRHHEQAIAMAEIYLNGEPGELNSLAKAIVRAQVFELGQMRGWLQMWNQPLAAESIAMDWMLAGSQAPDEELQAYLLSCQISEGGMPGLATAEQMQQLSNATGLQRDLLFLGLMGKHHEGGIPMLEFTGREAKHAAVRELAMKMLADQLRETETIEAAVLKLQTADN